MQHYFLVHDKSLRDYLNSFMQDAIYLEETQTLEKDAIVFVHFQSIQSDIDTILHNLQNSKIALLSDNPSFDEGYRYLRYNIKAYANSYMDKIHYEQLIGMLENNNNWFYPEFTKRLLSCAINHQEIATIPELEVLSKKEKEVAALVAKGLKNVQIAQALNIKERTVKQHLSNIYKKLDIHDRVSLAMLFS